MPQLLTNESHAFGVRITPISKCSLEDSRQLVYKRQFEGGLSEIRAFPVVEHRAVALIYQHAHTSPADVKRQIIQDITIHTASGQSKSSFNRMCVAGHISKQANRWRNSSSGSVTSATVWAISDRRRPRKWLRRRTTAIFTAPSVIFRLAATVA